MTSKLAAEEMDPEEQLSPGQRRLQEDLAKFSHTQRKVLLRSEVISARQSRVLPTETVMLTDPSARLRMCTRRPSRRRQSRKQHRSLPVLLLVCSGASDGLRVKSELGCWYRLPATCKRL